MTFRSGLFFVCVCLDLALCVFFCFSIALFCFYAVSFCYIYVKV